jgi:hypothetical protein
MPFASNGLLAGALLVRCVTAKCLPRGWLRARLFRFLFGARTETGASRRPVLPTIHIVMFQPRLICRARLAWDVSLSLFAMACREPSREERTETDLPYFGPIQPNYPVLDLHAHPAYVTMRNGVYGAVLRFRWHDSARRRHHGRNGHISRRGGSTTLTCSSSETEHHLPLTPSND